VAVQVEEAVRQRVTKGGVPGSGHCSSTSTDSTESADRAECVAHNYCREEARGTKKARSFAGFRITPRKTTDLRVTGSNPVGRAYYISLEPC